MDRDRGAWRCSRRSCSGLKAASSVLGPTRDAALLAGFAMASELTQANFPYLLAMFFVLLVLSLAALTVLTYRPRRPVLGSRLLVRRGVQ